MLMQRVRAVFEAIDSDMVIVSHGGVSRVFRGHLQNLPESEIIFWRNRRIGHAIVNGVSVV